ncbi:hypothetical protein KOAAANKH_01329 [Brevundimonas sp. NIBR10]|uniref:hypothetical protein n=1 Tax=Brevundimonas sp. NIBR10 TaxID=3015997 RepID=UPI0022F1B78D|nr:hypothetical protein [Brevundimonas sp. NIBR10]WGM46461.1 hypothetical protein KOAAANKH_01329 [Brevundimonas sp. NIBR10]
MSNTSLSKSVARYTKSLRISLGLASPELRAHADGRIEPSLLTRGTTGARLRAVETDLARLTQGWNQHIPQLLSVTADARVRAHEAADAYGRLDEITAGLAGLKAEIAALEAQIEALRPADPVPPSLADAQPVTRRKTPTTPARRTDRT